MAYISKWETEFFQKSTSTNWHAYKKFAHQFTYDEQKKILYKNVNGSDGIGKYNVIHIMCVCVCLSVCLSVCMCFIFYKPSNFNGNSVFE